MIVSLLHFYCSFEGIILNTVHGVPSNDIFSCRKAATHDSEIRHLYEEMEAQIKTEKERLLLMVEELACKQE